MVQCTHYTDQGYNSGKDGEQAGGRTVAPGDVGQRRPVTNHTAGGHVPLVQVGQFGRTGARDVPRPVDRPRQP